jgi:hypothetical protein
MSTKFSQLTNVGNAIAGDIFVGLRGGLDVQFDATSLPILPWFTLTVSQPLFINQGYFLANGGPASFALPTVAAVGQIIGLASETTQICTITQGAGQQIQFGSLRTTLGAGGSIATTAIGDSLTLVCNTANTGFVLFGAAQGIWTIT